MKQILVVDDAATVRMYHRKLFGEAGWQVAEAANGIEALEMALVKADDGPFDLYVVDVNMPKMDGYAFVRNLRLQAGLGAAPVMMVSTESQPADANKAEEAGANCYLVKPARPMELVLSAALLLGERDKAVAAAATMQRSPS